MVTGLDGNAHAHTPDIADPWAAWGAVPNKQGPCGCLREQCVELLTVGVVLLNALGSYARTGWGAGFGENVRRGPRAAWCLSGGFDRQQVSWME